MILSLFRGSYHTASTSYDLNLPTSVAFIVIWLFLIVDQTIGDLSQFTTYHGSSSICWGLTSNPLHSNGGSSSVALTSQWDHRHKDYVLFSPFKMAVYNVLQWLCFMLMSACHVNSAGQRSTLFIIAVSSWSLNLQAWHLVKDDAPLWLDRTNTLQKGHCLRFPWLGAVFSVSDLCSISHMTCTSSYPQVCTSSCSFRSPAPESRGESIER